MNPILAKWIRKLIRFQLERTPPQKLLALGEKKILNAFQRTARYSLAYQLLLQESNVDPDQVKSGADFVRLCPVLEKSTTFHRFPIEHLLVSTVSAASLASILTSSGHGKNGYAIGLSTAQQCKATPFQIDLGLELAFNVDSRRTLLINCLPMGVTFLSDATCVANVSVREDMACAIVQQAGHLFEQIILCGDPLFLKRLCDYSQEQKIDWQRYTMNVIIGEETFTESFRSYLAHCLGIDPASASSGLIGSSMGIAEIGLNLFNETRETISIRRACAADQRLIVALLGEHATTLPLPTLMCFNPLRIFVEIVDQDSHGAGDLVVSMLDRQAGLPLMRYKTGDRAMLVERAKLQLVVELKNLNLNLPVFPVIALLGRTKDFISAEWHVDFFKQALYSEPTVARELSGAFRVGFLEEGLAWEVQMRKSSAADSVKLGEALARELDKLSKSAMPAVHCFTYENFPYGKTLDYERKFVYCSK